MRGRTVTITESETGLGQPLLSRTVSVYVVVATGRAVATSALAGVTPADGVHANWLPSLLPRSVAVVLKQMVVWHH